MIRGWDEGAAALFDLVPGPLLFLVLLIVAVVGGALWYYYPAWLPGPRRPRVRKKRTKRPKAGPDVLTAAEPEPEQDADEPGDLGLADRLAAEGRYAEAIRQRLRDVIRDLVTAGVLAPQPGWTAAELAALAAAQRPAVGAPLAAATELFSEIWYGARPAGVAQDDRMRLLTAQVRTDLRATA